MRRFVLGCVLLAWTAARAQPAPTGSPPEPTPQAPSPSPGPGPTPGPTGAVDPTATAPAPPLPHVPASPPPSPSAVAPAPPPIAPPGTPAPGLAKGQNATEVRLAATALCAARDPRCDWLATFSSLERGSILRSLSGLGLAVEPAPWGKVIRRIWVRNEDVFAEPNWLRVFNFFHVTTRQIWVRSEMTIGEGEVWDDDRVIESQRRIKDPLYTSIVAMVPIRAPRPGQVDLLVVTRDIWSLRLNTQYTVQERSLTNFTISVSENNFLGRRKTLALGMIMDQGAIAAGPLYIDKNWLRSDQHFDLRVRYDRIFTRQALDVITPDGQRVPTGSPGGIEDEGRLRAEGTAAAITLARPLWSLASTWGVAGAVSYRNAITRQYFGTGLRAYNAPETLEADNLPRHFRMRTWSARLTGTRQWGKRFKHQLEAGYSVSSQRPSLLSYFEADPLLEQAFARDVFPRSEVISQPFVEYSLFQARFGMLRNIDTYEIAEDIRFGPSASVGIAQGLELLGSSFNFTRPSATVSWTVPWGRDGFARVSAGGQVRIQSALGSARGMGTIDNTATWQLRVASPTTSFLRVVGQVGMDTRWNDSQNLFYTLGAENGLRGYRIGQLLGDRRFVAQLEARTVPVPFWVLRVGGVVFYDGGGAASSLGTMPYLHDVGVGARMLIPQSSRDLFRFDLAFPLAGAPGTPAGAPRFIAGFDSYF